MEGIAVVHSLPSFYLKIRNYDLIYLKTEFLQTYTVQWNYSLAEFDYI